MRRFSRLASLLALGITLNLCGPGLPVSQANTPVLSEQQAIELALRAIPGKVLAIQLQRNEQGSFYKVRILTMQGRVRTLRIDAHSGSVLGESKE